MLLLPSRIDTIFKKMFLTITFSDDLAADISVTKQFQWILEELFCTNLHTIKARIADDVRKRCTFTQTFSQTSQMQMQLNSFSTSAPSTLTSTSLSWISIWPRFLCNFLLSCGVLYVFIEPCTRAASMVGCAYGAHLIFILRKSEDREKTCSLFPKAQRLFGIYPAHSFMQRRCALKRTLRLLLS